LAAKVRILRVEGPIPAALGLALEETLLRGFVEGRSGPAVLVWRAQPAVVIGVNPKTLEEVDLDVVQELGITMLRRESGGGAVYLDPGCLVYSVITHRATVPARAKERYRILSSGLIELLSDLRLEPEFRELGVWVNGKKISGTAEWMLHEGLLHHGTLLVSTDLDALDAVLAKPKAPVVNLSSLLGGNINLESLSRSLAERVARTLGMPEWTSLTDEEIRFAESLLQKYSKISESLSETVRSRADGAQISMGGVREDTHVLEAEIPRGDPRHWAVRTL